MNNNLFFNNKMEMLYWNEDIVPAIAYFHYTNRPHVVYNHWHKELEINCLFYGSAEFYTSNGKQLINSLGVHICNSEELHSIVPLTWESPTGLVGMTLQLKDSFVRSLIPDFDNCIFSVDNLETNNEIANLMIDICNLYQANESLENKIRILARLCDLIALLYEKCKKPRLIEDISVQRDKELFKDILYYLNTHYKDQITLQDLASKFYFSREYFSRFFKHQAGTPLKEYIMYYRTEMAKNELISTNNTLLDIALNHGFTNETMLIKWFKKYYGITPAKYRKEMSDS